MSVKKLAELRKTKLELLEEIKKSAKALFKEASATLFEEFPVIEEFRWTQYTPYFNDGDTCTFSSNHSYARVVFNDSTEEDEDDYDNEGYDESTPLHKKAGKAVEKFLGNFDDDDMLSMFGDHVKVSVTKKGIEVEDYDHD